MKGPVCLRGKCVTFADLRDKLPLEILSGGYPIKVNTLKLNFFPKILN